MSDEDLPDYSSGSDSGSKSLPGEKESAAPRLVFPPGAKVVPPPPRAEMEPGAGVGMVDGGVKVGKAGQVGGGVPDQVGGGVPVQVGDGVPVQMGGCVPAQVDGGVPFRKALVVKNMGEETLAMLVPNDVCGSVKKSVNVELHKESYRAGDVAVGLSSFGYQDKFKDTIIYRTGLMSGEMAVEKLGRFAVSSGKPGAARCAMVKVAGRCFEGARTEPELLKQVVTLWYFVGKGKFSEAKYENMSPRVLFTDPVFNAVKGATTFQATLIQPQALGGAQVVRVVATVPVQVLVAGRLFSDGWCGDVADEGSIKERLEYPESGKRLFLLSPIAELVKRKGDQGVQGPTGAD